MARKGPERDFWIDATSWQPRNESITDFSKEAHIFLVVRSSYFRTVGNTRSNKRIEGLDVECGVLNDESA